MQARMSVGRTFTSRGRSPVGTGENLVLTAPSRAPFTKSNAAPAGRREEGVADERARRHRLVGEERVPRRRLDLRDAAEDGEGEAGHRPLHSRRARVAAMRHAPGRPREGRGPAPRDRAPPVTARY